MRLLPLVLCAAAFGQSRSSLDQQRASVERQRESIRKQTAGAPAVSLSEAVCDPLPVETIAPIIDSAAEAQHVKANLLRAVIEQESGFRPCAVSPKGAQGLMQLMPATAGDLAVRDPFDPKENIEAGAKYLKQLIDKYAGNLAQALGAYNAGPGAADDSGGVPNNPETRDYVKAILDKIEPIQTDPPSTPKPKPTEN